MADKMVLVPCKSNGKNKENTGCPLSFETGGYNCCFFLNFVPLHIESPYNFGGGHRTYFGGKKPSAEGKWACWKYCVEFSITNFSYSFKKLKIVYNSHTSRHVLVLRVNFHIPSSTIKITYACYFFR